MPLFTTLPLDLTGTAVSNHRVNESRVVPLTTGRVIAPDYGPFYTESFVIRTMPDNTLLTHGDDYEFSFPMSAATEDSGKEVVAIIVITNTEISGEVKYDYQAVGGDYSSYIPAIDYAVKALELDTRAIVFSNLIGVPVAFPPSPHLHHMQDTVGWDEFVNILGEIKTIIETGDETKFNQVQTKLDELEALYNARNVVLDGHNNRITTLETTKDGFGTYTILANGSTVPRGRKFIPDNSAGAINYGMPTSPQDGDYIEWRPSSWSFADSPMTFTASDKNFTGGATTLVVNIDGVAGILRYSSLHDQWLPFELSRSIS